MVRFNILLAVGLWTGALTPVSGNAAESVGLESLLDDATEVVTSSKLNIDYTPSVLSLLEHDQMRLLGVKTLFEALDLLPGIETSVNQLGVKKVIVRGFDNPNNFVFDKAKLLIDGVAIEMGMYGNSSFYYDLPIDLIERIEVMRGPGSALYGTGAFNGAINVVTRHGAAPSEVLFVGYGSDDYMMGGMYGGYALASGVQLDLDGYYQKHDRTVRVDDDFMVIPLGGPDDFSELGFDGPYKSHEKLRDFSLGLTLGDDVWTLRSRFKNNTNGNYFGWDEMLEMDDSQRNVQQYFFAEFEQRLPLSEATAWTTRLGYSWYDLDLTGQNYYEDPLAGGDWAPYDFHLEEEERQSWIETALETTAFEGHKMTAGLQVKQMALIGSRLTDDVNTIFEAMVPDYPIPGSRPLLEEGLLRTTYSLYLRDSVVFSDRLTGLLALRADHYTEHDKTYPSAQLGLVYMPEEQWHFKLNYGHAFRVPSWVEQYTAEYGDNDGTRGGNPDLDPETTDTVELVAIWRDGSVQHLQTNLYYSVMHDVIDVCDDGDTCTAEYVNLDDRKSYGLEAAYTFVTPSLDEFHLNATYNKTTYENTGEHFEQIMPGVAQTMLKGYYIHYLTPATTVSTLVKYYGMRTRNQGGDYGAHPRPDKGLDPYTTVDVTLGTRLGKTWQLLGSVKNLFDADIAYASFYGRQVEGIPRYGRTFLIQAECRF